MKIEIREIYILVAVLFVCFFKSELTTPPPQKKTLFFGCFWDMFGKFMGGVGDVWGVCFGYFRGHLGKFEGGF